MIGQRFGKLVVVSTYQKPRADGQSFYLVCICQCDCGNTKEVLKQHLLAEKETTRSCGCLRPSQKLEKDAEIVGLRFGKLLVKERLDEKSKDGRTLYLCLCDCGTEIKVTGKNLKNKNTSSCGCSRRNDLAGQTINGIKIIRTLKHDSPNSKAKDARAECICPLCNSTFIARQKDIAAGWLKSCGCEAKAIVELAKSLSQENTSELAETDPRIKGQRHGFSRDPMYKIWFGMMERCYNPENTDYDSYGGKGVRVLKIWAQNPGGYFDDIKRIIGPRPSLQHTVDRINPSGHYVQNNVRWLLHSLQAFNTRKNWEKF